MLKCQVFTGSGTFNVPATVSGVYASWAAPGGGGLNATTGQADGQEGGGSGEFAIWFPIPVTPGGTLTVTFGTPGVGGVIGVPSGTGDPTSIGSFSLLGGLGGRTHPSLTINGGGPGGGRQQAGQPGEGGSIESPCAYGGTAGGGNSGTGGQDGHPGGQQIGQWPGTSAPHNTNLNRGGGAQGGNGILAAGGAGGDGTAAGAAADGSVGSAGCGGGGGSGVGNGPPLEANTDGAAGGASWAHIFWFE